MRCHVIHTLPDIAMRRATLSLSDRQAFRAAAQHIDATPPLFFSQS